MNDERGHAKGAPRVPPGLTFERWSRTAPPFLVARVRVLGTLYGLMRHAQRCRREADRLRALALRSAKLHEARPCPRCDGRGAYPRVERAPTTPPHPPLLAGHWCPLATIERMSGRAHRGDDVPRAIWIDCAACRSHRLALDAELAGAAWRARELDSWAGAVEALILEMLPAWTAAVARTRREEAAARRAERRAELARHADAQNEPEF